MPPPSTGDAMKSDGRNSRPWIQFPRSLLRDLGRFERDKRLKLGDTAHFLAVAEHMVDTPPPWHLTIDQVRIACGMTRQAQAAAFIKRALAVGILTGQTGNLSAPVAAENWGFWNEHSKRQSANASNPQSRDQHAKTKRWPRRRFVVTARSANKSEQYQQNCQATALPRLATLTKTINKPSPSPLFERQIRARDEAGKMRAAEKLEELRTRKPAKPCSALRMSLIVSG